MNNPLVGNRWFQIDNSLRILQWTANNKFIRTSLIHSCYSLKFESAVDLFRSILWRDILLKIEAIYFQDIQWYDKVIDILCGLKTLSSRSIL